MLQATGDETASNLLELESEIREEMCAHRANHKEEMAQRQAQVLHRSML